MASRAQPASRPLAKLVLLIIALKLGATAARRGGGGRKNSKDSAPHARSCTALLDEGAQLYNQRHYAEAAAAYRRCIAVEPGNSKAHYNLGSSLQTLSTAGTRYEAMLAIGETVILLTSPLHP